MHPWERRLRDLATILKNCGITYFDPETFRINTNQFLQTSRTVTFIIQKNKESIPNFDSWYKTEVVEPWSNDTRMTWAKDSRNKIEKEGDLEVHSSIGARLIFSYFEEDIVLPCGRGELVWNVKRLMRFARKQLPTGVSDVAVVQIDRRWVANSLPDWELLHALTYVYARIRDVCDRLARHLGSRLGDDVPEATIFDPLMSDARKTRYLRLSSSDIASFSSSRIPKAPDFVPPPKLLSFVSDWGDKKPSSLAESVNWFGGMARMTFETFGNHVPMLFMLNHNWEIVDQVTTHFEDQGNKYLFWRSMADRVLYVKPAAVVWIAEAWLRSFKGHPQALIRNMPIIGEMLSVVGLDHAGNSITIRWRVLRDSASSDPRLENEEVIEGAEAAGENYFVPVRRAFQRVQHSGAA